ncbi:MAG: CE1 family esterase [Solirubrobacteraceae bacterium]
MKGHGTNRRRSWLAQALGRATAAGLALAALGASPMGASAATTSCALSPTSGTVTRMLGQREYQLHVPQGLPGPEVPLLISLHGAGSDGAQDEYFTGWSKFADAHHFIVAYPDATFPDEPSAPYLGGGVWDPYTQGSPDVPFLTQVVSDIETSYCVDPSRVYVNGWSNGAVMSQRVACDAAGVFAAADSYAGGDPTAWPQSGVPAGRYSGAPCHPSRPISIGMIVGQEDFTYAGLSQNASLWEGIDGCSGSPASESDA